MEKFMQCMKDHDGIHLHCHQQTKVKLLLLFKHRLFFNPISFRILGLFGLPNGKRSHEKRG